MNNPLITVIMPVYNGETYLEEAIQSVMNQTFQNWELICVNDGSTDGSLIILNKYKSLDERIIVLDRENSGTVAGGRNHAVPYIRGEYVQMLDCDDLLSEDLLAKVYSKAKESGADYVIPDMYLFMGEKTQITRQYIGFKGNRQVCLTPKEAFKFSIKWEISGVGLIKAELIKKLRYDPTTVNGDEYSNRLFFLNSNKIAFAEGVYFYRKHPASTTVKVSPRRFEYIKTDFKLFDLSKLYELDNDTISICQKKITDNIMGCFQFYFSMKEAFSKKERKKIMRSLYEDYRRVEHSFFKAEQNLIKYLIKRTAFSNFRLLKTYSLCAYKIKATLNLF